MVRPVLTNVAMRFVVTEVVSFFQAKTEIEQFWKMGQKHAVPCAPKVLPEPVLVVA